MRFARVLSSSWSKPASASARFRLLPRAHDVDSLLTRTVRFPKLATYAASRPIAPPISFGEAPIASSDRTRRPIETVAFPVSIFATRNWLDRNSLAMAA